MSPLASTSLIFANPQWLWIAVLCGLLALVLVVLSYRRLVIALKWKALAIVLKCLAFLLLVINLLEPVLVNEFPRDGANDLVLVADNSRGLGVADQGRELQRALNHSDPENPPDWLLDLREQFRLQEYQVDRRLARVDDFSQLDFSGQASALLTSIKSLRTRYEKRPLAAMVVLTDGNATDSHSVESTLACLAATAARSAVPVFPVVVGQPLGESVLDLAIREVEVTQSAFEDAPLTFTVSADARGKFPNGVEIYAEDQAGKEVISEAIIFAGGKGAGPRSGSARLKIAGVRKGVSFYNVGIRGLATAAGINELTLENNSRRVAVNRSGGPYRVLYVGGRPNWEYKFLRRALQEDGEIDLVALMRLAKREPKFEWRGRTGESGNPLFRGFNKELPEETQSYDEPVLIRLNTKDDQELRDGFPRDAESLFPEYDAIVFDDVESEFLSTEQQKLVESYVARRGGTVMMLGGQESFNNGKWENTPMARILPVYVDRIEPGGPAQFATYNLSREGWLEPWMRLHDNQSDETSSLAQMPQFFSINRVPAIKPGASLLATVTDREDRQHPAIVTHRFGEGRSAAVTIGDLWRWGMKDEPNQKALAKMWRQMIRWAVADVPGRVTQEVSEIVEGTLPMTQIDVRVRTASFQPQDDATIIFELTRPGSEEPIALLGDPSLQEAGVFSTNYFVEEQGDYLLKTTAHDSAGEIIGELDTGWTYNPGAEELSSLEPNRDLLEKIAAVSGGKVLAINQISQLPAILKDLNAPVMDTRQRPLWHTPWIFILALICIVGEWAIRRWKGGLL